MCNGSADERFHELDQPKSAAFLQQMQVPSRFGPSPAVRNP
jgi:hypothetical protein